jgi:hypothetical protein
MLHIPEIREAVNQEEGRASLWIIALWELIHLEAGLDMGKEYQALLETNEVISMTA